ncbi:hypothetical protein [Bacillus swezeyi]|uniref:Uncharacterized protein n=1 Tax=Bacillus swezeyi TaxID=1925020 RepID=A0A5M8RTU5_9BACI|nr:hypothetical protein [Bacillus swezeyi]KAA6450324.1 hypothetical protein DX927_05445 [Bacillus swezeyi]TYS36865.1 hypothetical protein FZC77_05300 [Bacillus swezeyi]
MYNSIALEIKGMVRIEHTCSEDVNYTGSVEVSGSSPLCSIPESLDVSRGFFIVKETRLVLKKPFEA